MSLPDDAILSKAEMLDVLVSDARFPHASVIEISEFLDNIYTSKGRESPDRSECAPDVIYNAWRQGKISDQLYIARDTVGNAVLDVKALCCICGEISITHDYQLPIPLQLHLAPSLTTFTYIEDGEKHTVGWGEPPPICNKCAYHFSKRKRRRDYWDDNSAMWNVALAEVAANRTAKERIHKNASVWKKLRFDPRSPANC